MLFEHNLCMFPKKAAWPIFLKTAIIFKYECCFTGRFEIYEHLSYVHKAICHTVAVDFVLRLVSSANVKVVFYLQTGHGKQQN